MSQIDIKKAATVIHHGGVIAYPTEGVWGLGCDPWQAEAVGKILKIKNRPWQKGLLLVAASIDQVKPFLTQLTKEQYEKVCSTWPGPNTWVVPCDGLPSWVTGNHTTIALRVSNHPIVQQLCNAVGGPIISTSANPAGKEPAKTALKVQCYFGDKVDYIVHGALGGSNKPTTIRDAVTNQQLR